MDPRLAASIRTLAGVSPQRAELLEAKGLRSVLDLLFCFPRDYEDFSDIRPIAELEADEPQAVVGEVTEVDARGGFGKHRVGIVVSDESDSLRALWFNQTFMRDKFAVGQRVRLSGKPRKQGLRWEMAHPRVAWLDEDESQDADEGLLPVYPLTEGVSQYHMRRIVASAVESAHDAVEEVFSPELLERHDLAPIDEALLAIHRPADDVQRDRARRRFVFQELFVLQLALAARRHQQRVGFKAPELPVDAQLDARIRRLIPFELTAGQETAIQQVAADLALDVPMNRLLQGEVGSGKTVVALYAMLACVKHGQQAVLLAPTEVLARQHAQTFDAMLRASRVDARLLVGGMAPAEKQSVRDAITAGEVDLAIGTHALLEESIDFARLGLAVIDEQHKFGVRQRAALRRGDRSPHYLVMTATPIPRTMSMTQFGDLDVSTITELPAGREPVSTYLIERSEQAKWWEHVREKLREGRQAFIVTPLVDESEALEAASAEAGFERLTNRELDAFRVGLLHGRMSPQEKERTCAWRRCSSATTSRAGSMWPASRRRRARPAWCRATSSFPPTSAKVISKPRCRVWSTTRPCTASSCSFRCPTGSTPKRSST